MSDKKVQRLSGPIKLSYVCKQQGESSDAKMAVELTKAKVVKE